jgi:hypothetical protein
VCPPLFSLSPNENNTIGWIGTSQLVDGRIALDVGRMLNAIVQNIDAIGLGPSTPTLQYTAAAEGAGFVLGRC